MTHPLGIGFDNCQQISVLSLPACALTGPLGPCHYREQRCASSQGCSPGNTPFPDLLPQHPPSQWLNSGTASQHPGSWEGFLSFCSIRRKWLAPNLLNVASRTWGKKYRAQSWTDLVIPPIQIYFICFTKAGEGLEQYHLDCTCSKKPVWKPDPAVLYTVLRNWC